MSIKPTSPQRLASKNGLLSAVFLALLLLLQSNCRQDMHDQPKYESLEASDFFGDGKASHRPPEGTVARGQLREDELLYTGKTNDDMSMVFPYQITRDILTRGHQRYNVFCSPCHDRAGTGKGIIVERGMKQPPSLHIVRLKEAVPGYFFDVITNGYGEMYGYATRVPVHDRWAIVAYIRALQLSQGASLGDVSQEDVKRIKGETQ